MFCGQKAACTMEVQERVNECVNERVGEGVKAMPEYGEKPASAAPLNETGNKTIKNDVVIGKGEMCITVLSKQNIYGKWR